ncbi:MAG: glycosyltransferase [Candidatus Moranbacteria bacterium]|nr:glycosyltransferase [Candidatus Moranbacteria bacterium]
MKTLLIKTGKAWNALRQEGLVRGGKRVAKSFVAQFGRVRPGDILFVTVGVGDSARYRAHNQAEELRLHGFKCSVTIQDNPFLPGYADKFKIFVFHRTLFTSKVAKLFECAKKSGKEIIFETDDLVFDPKYIKETDHYKKMNALERQQYEKGVGEEILKDPYVKICVTTTPYLAKILESYGKKVFVSKNKLSINDLEIIEKLVKNKAIYPDGSSTPVRIGYFAGTKGHDRDFATVEDALVRILEKYSNVNLVLAGPLNASEKFGKLQNQIEKLPFASREEHFKNIANVDINVIPLEKDDPFCEAKSELKFFEAGILGVPSVAVDNQTYRETIDDGVDGFLAGNEEEWFEKLEKLVLDDGLRRNMGKEAREKSLREYTTKNSHSSGYYDYLRLKI